MVAVVIDQHCRTAFTIHWLQREFTEEIKTATSPLEALQRTQNSLVVNALFRSNRNRSCGVQRVMTTWRIQGDAHRLFVLAQQRKVPLRANLLIIFYTHVGIFAEAVSRGLTSHTR